MLFLRPEIGIPVLAERSRLLPEERIDIYSLLICERRRITSCHAVICKDFQRRYYPAFDNRAHEIFIRQQVGQSHLRVQLPAYIVAECCVVVRTQAQVYVIFVFESYVFLHEHTVIVQEAQPFVRCLHTRAGNNLSPVPHIGAVVDGLVIVGTEILESRRRERTQQILVAVPVLGVQIHGDTHVFTVKVIDTSRIRRTSRFLLRMDQKFIGSNDLVAVQAIIQPDRSL